MIQKGSLILMDTLVLGMQSSGSSNFSVTKSSFRQVCYTICGLWQAQDCIEYKGRLFKIDCA